MALKIGSRLGPYEIQAAVGAGGMGEVYRARDTRLDRTVAIKVLAAHVAADPDLRYRFEREARAVAALNHPHICTLHDIGRQDDVDYLVMEYVEGETLHDRLAKGPLPLDQVLLAAIAIADALDKAHRKGITHRDLKPGNIVLTRMGVKLLDFGLAKLRHDGAPAVTASSALATANDPVTAKGTILGTLQYMAPEQLEGRDTDGRTDIFALGAVIYEMATGKRAFDGTSPASVIGRILETDPPPMSSLQPMTPPALDRVVRKCLKKDADERWQSARDVADELRWIAEGSSQATIPVSPVARPRVNSRVGWAVGAVGIVMVAVAAPLVYFRPVPAVVPPLRFTVASPEKATLDAAPAFLAISPDGSRLAFIARDPSGRSQLWTRALDALEAQPLPGTEGAAQPFWSADSRFLGFFSGGALKKVAVSGGPPQTITELKGGAFAGDWNSEGIILLSVGQGPVQRVPAAGGSLVPVTTLDASRKENGHSWARFLPDGRHFVYFARTPNREGDGIYLGSLDSMERTLVLSASSNVAYASPGFLLYNRDGTLMAQPFDAERLQLSGEAVPVADGLQFNRATSRAAFAVSQNGVLAYRGGGAAPPRTLVWVSRSGREEPLAVPTRFFQQPRLSPDGQRVAVEIDEESNQVWLHDLRRDTLTRLTFEGTDNETPVWSTDGQRVAFFSNKEGPLNLFWQMADGTGGLERLTTSEVSDAPMSVSADGQLLAFTRMASAGNRDIFVLRLADRKAEPFLQTPFIEGGAVFSPDGRWLAYLSNESARPEVYVRPYPGPGGKWQISTDGGTEPMWNRNGRELFFRSGTKMMAVDIATQPTFSAGKPTMLFEGQYVSTPFPQTFPHYDVAADGQRFLMVKQGEQAITQINVVQNWPEDLKRRAPSGTVN